MHAKKFIGTASPAEYMSQKIWRGQQRQVRRNSSPSRHSKPAPSEG